MFKNTSAFCFSACLCSTTKGAVAHTLSRPVVCCTFRHQPLIFSSDVSRGSEVKAWSLGETHTLSTAGLAPPPTIPLLLCSPPASLAAVNCDPLSAPIRQVRWKSRNPEQTHPEVEDRADPSTAEYPAASHRNHLCVLWFIFLFFHFAV